jgi:hypothetical protein
MTSMKPRKTNTKTLWTDRTGVWCTVAQGNSYSRGGSGATLWPRYRERNRTAPTLYIHVGNADNRKCFNAASVPHRGESRPGIGVS